LDDKALQLKNKGKELLEV
jgi:metallophosphoesterase superfamily enzyme